MAPPLLVFSDLTLAQRRREGAIHPIISGEERSLAKAGLSAYVADRHEPSDGDGGDGNSAVAKSRSNIPNIPNTVRAAALHTSRARFSRWRQLAKSEVPV
jgi:hypothetical protein